MKKIWKATGIAIICGLASLIILYGMAYLSGKPEIGKNHVVEMYDHDQNVFYASVDEKNGQWAELDDISEHFLHAIIDIEDQTFYYHQGFDPIGICRAALNDLINGNLAQGGSTITQQYVKNLFLTNEKTWIRKLKEAWLTMQVETHYSKDEILEGYVNTIYFGAGIYGIQNASQYFFSKDASQLNIQEASLLAGIINGPELYSPTRNPALVSQRQQLVLLAMLENGHLTQQQYDLLITLETPLHLNQEDITNDTLDYFKDQVLDEIAVLGLEDALYREEGLKIYTTLDSQMQNAISQAMDDVFDAEDQVQSAVVMLEPGSGAIRALAGGRDYSLSQYNRASNAKRQMASTVKPLLYYDALINGFNPTTKLISEKTTFRLSENRTYAPSNYHDIYPNKEITMLEAVAASDNIYAVKTHLFLGEETLASRLKSFGYDAQAIPALALGTQETSPLQLADVYNTFASEGIYYAHYCIERIENSQGKILYQHDSQPIKKLDQDICLVLNQMLTATFDSRLQDTLSPTMLSYKSDVTYAAKTGTSDWDSWTVAFNPQITMTIWVGYDDNIPLDDRYKFSGRNLFQTISQATQNPSQATWYQPTKNIVQIPLDPLTGNYQADGSIYWFYQPLRPTSSKRV